MIEYETHDWKSHLLDIKGSMVREIMGRVTTCVSWSLAVVAFHKYVHPVNVSTSVHTLVGLALGLLLVFRTNASYDRYWEGRRLWGGIVNECRNLARASRALLRSDPLLYARLVTWTAAFPFATMHRLRDDRALGSITGSLPADQVAAVLDAENIPLAVAVKMNETLVEARDRGLISDFLLSTLDNNVQQLIDFLGGCERIHRTPLPFVYVVHLRRALILYCFTIPFALVGDYGWLVVLDTLFVAYMFFGIEEIGVEIEDPFGVDTNDLPLEGICARIETEVLSLIPEPTSNLVTV